MALMNSIVLETVLIVMGSDATMVFVLLAVGFVTVPKIA
jgi:hypothetical protein